MKGLFHKFKEKVVEWGFQERLESKVTFMKIQSAAHSGKLIRRGSVLTVEADVMVLPLRFLPAQPPSLSALLVTPAVKPSLLWGSSATSANAHHAGLCRNKNIDVYVRDMQNDFIWKPCINVQF